MIARHLLRAACFFAGVCGTLLICELLLRALPVNGGAYTADPDASWPASRLVPNSSYTFSDGWSLRNVHHGRINNFGYAAPFDYVPGSAGVVIIGDSFVESLMNDYDDTLQGILRRELAPQNVMAFGTINAALPHYLGVAQLVRRYFSPQWAVIVIIAGDYVDGFAKQPGFYHWAPDRTPPIELTKEVARSATQKLLRTVAVARYVRTNLEFRWAQAVKLHRGADAHPPTCVPTSLSEPDERLIEEYVAALPAALGLPASHVVLVFDSDRKAIYAGLSRAAAESCPARDVLARARLMSVARTGGLQVIDSDPIFRRYYAQTGQGVDYLPFDLHWNATGHRLIAEEVARIIKGTASPAIHDTAESTTCLDQPCQAGQVRRQTH
jgi:hypothetical protein